MQTLRIYLLALRYWAIDGDSWEEAVWYARAIVLTFDMDENRDL